MNKKLMAVAVAGALAAPGVALAQGEVAAPVAGAASSVTISGWLKAGPDQVSYSNATPTTAAAGVFARRTGNQSENRLSDHSSRIYFRIREDLGNGLAAVGQFDLRVNIATSTSPTGNSCANCLNNGANWVGIDSRTWGRLTFGKRDLHYGKGGDLWNVADAGHLQAWGSALFDFANRPTAATATAAKGGVQAAIGNVTRTQQVVVWDAPNWQGFDGIIAYSANPLTAGGGSASTGGDLGAGLNGTGPNVGQVINRKGNGWNINPRYTTKGWSVQYSYWNAKGDINSAGTSLANPACVNAVLVNTAACTGQTNTAGVTTQPAATSGQQLIQDDQRADVLAGNVNWRSWTFGLGWNRAKTTNVASGLVTGDRSAWEFSSSYKTGPHLFGFAYTKANDSKDITTTAAVPISGNDTGAKMFSLTYIYALSRRTSAGLTFAQVTNSAAGTYNLFYNTPTAFSGTNTGVLPGERLQLLGAQVMHKF